MFLNGPTETVKMSENVKTQVSKYVSYLLRHNPEDLKIDREGFVHACMH